MNQTRGLLPFFLLLLMLASAAVVAQPSGDITQHTHPLDSVEISAKKIRATDILDSVLFYASRNYPVHVGLKARLEISLMSDNDTFFRRSQEAHFARFGKEVDYFLAVFKSDQGDSVVNKLNENQKLRMVQHDHFPMMSISKLITKNRKEVSENVVFLSYKRISDCYEITVRYKKVQGPALWSRTDLDSGYEDVFSFKLITINRKDWAVLSISLVTIEADQINLDLAKSSRTYEEMTAVISRVLNDRKAKRLTTELGFKKLPDQTYLFSDHSFSNDLFLVSHNLIKRRISNPEHSVYTYRVYDVDIMDTRPAQIRIFTLKSFYEKP